VKYASMWLDLRILVVSARLLVLRRLSDGVRNADAAPALRAAAPSGVEL
jgi:hypothetical protein